LYICKGFVIRSDMIIGIVAHSAFEEKRTGVEEYAYQLINHLAMLPESKRHQFFLYVKKKRDKPEGFPENFIIKPLSAPIFWSQGRLALEMLFHKPDVLFVPGHILPRIHPKNSIVTIHGLEFEYFPEMYPTRHQRYLRFATKYSAHHAKKIIAASQTTKDDLMELYGIDASKIYVVPHGVNVLNENEISESQPLFEAPYILFIGTKEKKKNIFGLIKAFVLLKEKYKIPHKLILAGGKPNRRFYQEENIDKIIKELKCKEDIVNLDFVSEKEKWNLLRNAQIFAYPSFYEGFGMPILEAQAAGVPIVTSNVSALPEIAGSGAILIDPRDIEEMTEAIYKIINNEGLGNDLIKKGFDNVKKFSWEKCAKETLQQLTSNI